MISKVYIICNAYESGIGHGLQRDGVCNPYSKGGDEHEAWGIGYKEGKERAEDQERDAAMRKGAWVRG